MKRTGRKPVAVSRGNFVISQEENCVLLALVKEVVEDMPEELAVTNNKYK